MDDPTPARPLLVYDGNCGFCRGWIARWQAITGDRVDYAPAQEVAERFAQVPRDRFDQSVVLIMPDGEITTGAEAVFRTLALAPGFSPAVTEGVDSSPRQEDRNGSHPRP